MRVTVIYKKKKTINTRFLYKVINEVKATKPEEKYSIIRKNIYLIFHNKNL